MDKEKIKEIILEYKNKTNSKNLEELVINLGGRVIDTDEKYHSIIRKNDFIIFVNPEYTYTSRNDRNMQIAHEIGHIILHSTDKKNISDGEVDTRRFDIGSGVENEQATIVRDILFEIFNIKIN